MSLGCRFEALLIVTSIVRLLCQFLTFRIDLD